MLPDQNLSLKYFVEVICQFITSKSFGKHTFTKILPLQYFATYGIQKYHLGLNLRSRKNFCDLLKIHEKMKLFSLKKFVAYGM